MEIKDKIIFDGITKTAIIMRDGIYLYLAKEIGDTSRPANDVVRVYRARKEVEKAKARFEELQRLPLTINHPFSFVNLQDENSYKEGTATDPFLKEIGDNKTLGCKLNLNEKAFDLYEKGIKELSCGWEGNFVKADNENYDYVQEFVDFNHIAILPDGRAGSLCSIIDNNINLIKIMSENKDDILNDIKKTVLDAMSEREQKDEEKKEGEALEKEEETKDKKKKDKKYKDKEEETEDEDKEKEDGCKVGDTSIQDALIADFSSIFKAIDKGAVDVKDCIGRSPAEIKQFAVEKIAKKKIELKDSAILDAYFDVSIENYSHPSWTANKVEDKSIDDASTIINNINFLK